MHTPKRYLRLPALLSLVPLSETTVWRLEKRGDFPRRIRLGVHSVAWDEAEVLDWLASRDRGTRTPTTETQSA